MSCEFYSSLTAEELLPAFLNNMSLAERTSVEYRRSIALLCNALQKDFLEITKEDAISHFDKMYSRYCSGSLTRKTIHVRLSCYLSFARFIVEHYPYLEYNNPFIHVRRVEVDDSVPVHRMPSIEEMDLIMTSAKNERRAYYVILALVSRCGMSAGDVLRMTESMLLYKNNTLSVVFKHNNDNKKDHIVFLPEDVAIILDSYVSDLSIWDAQGHLFYNKHKKHMSIRNLDSAVKRIVDRCLPGKNYTIRDIRTHAIMNFRKAGVSSADSAAYVGLGSERISAYYEAPLSYKENCPANLTNYRLVD